MLLACAIFFLFSFSQAWETSLKISKEEDDPFCKISVNDTLQQNLIFEDVGVAANVTVLGGYRDEECQLRVLVVGGGGNGLYGGGGSGHLKYFNMSVQDEAIDVMVAVGGMRQPSSISIGSVTTSAMPGEDGFHKNDEGGKGKRKGGDGYSGGGGWCYEELEDCESSYAGGSDGHDGHGESSKGTYGHGTGDDLGSFHFENFALTPGQGGDSLTTLELRHFGGGGGGLLVNGEGPQRDFQYVGEGYGGGGDGSGGYGYGMQGVILMEVGP